MSKDVYNEQRLRNEVIYLHWLWHQGPPAPGRTQLRPPTHPSLQPLNPTRFKKSTRTPKPRKPMKSQEPSHCTSPHQVTSTEWPCQPSPSPGASGPAGWPTFPQSQPTRSEPHFSTPQGQAWFAGNQCQLKVVKSVKEFFKSLNSDSDDDYEESPDIDSDNDSVDENGVQDEHVSSFFLKLFDEDRELRNFYEKNYANGEFSCLVCGGVGFIKRFRDCVALVQHTITISNTKKRRAHRVFGQVVCKVLGWDIDKLPSTVSSISEKRIVAVSKSGEGESEDNFEGKAQENFVGCNKDISKNPVANVDSVHEKNNKETIEKESGAAELLHSGGVSAPAESFQGSGWSSQQMPDSSHAGISKWSSFPQPQSSSSEPLLLSPKTQTWFVANRSQFRALKVVAEFFKSVENSDRDVGGDDDGDDDSAESMGEDELKNEGCYDLDFGLFMRLFDEYEELRDYYLNNNEKGEFSCLVCGGLGKIKRFKDCVALVQHAVTITKTKERKAHRVYGQAICKVLNWDMDKLPSIISLISEKKNVGLNNSINDEALVNLETDKNDVASTIVDNVESSNKIIVEANRGKESIDTRQLPGNGVLTVAERYQVETDGNTSAKHSSNDVQDEVGGSTENALNWFEADSGTTKVMNDVGVDSATGISAEEIKGKESIDNEQSHDTGDIRVAQEGIGKKQAEDN